MSPTWNSTSLHFLLAWCTIVDWAFWRLKRSWHRILVSPGKKWSSVSRGLRYTTWYRDCWIAPWKLVLHQYSAQWSQLTQFLGCSDAKHCRYCSKLWLVICPSVWGWYAELILSWVFIRWNISVQKWLRKTESGRGIPWRRTTSLTNNWATLNAEKNVAEEGNGHTWRACPWR